MGIEKQIEKSIIHYLELRGAVVEGMQSGKVMIKKGNFNHRMTLQKEGCPDVTCLYKGEYIGIEVKKNQKEVEHWLKQEERRKNGEEIPKSYKRTEDQIKYKENILKNGGTFILTCELKEVIDYIKEVEKKSN